MTKSESIAELAKALAVAQGEIQNAKKDSENPFFKSRYADLAAVRESIQGPFAKNGLAVVQLPSTMFTQDGSIVSVETILMHASGEWVSGEQSVLLPQADPQKIGSATTYLRRYGLSAIAGVASEMDDDGNAASQPAQKPATQEHMKKVINSTELAALKQAAVDACKVLNEAGDKPTWSAKRLNEFSLSEFNAEVDQLNLDQMRELVKRLSNRLDVVKKSKAPDKAREAKIAELLKSNTKKEIADAQAELKLVGVFEELSLSELTELDEYLKVPF